MSYSAAEKRQKIGKVGADDKGSADVLSCYRPKLDLTVRPIRWAWLRARPLAPHSEFCWDWMGRQSS